MNYPAVGDGPQGSALEWHPDGRPELTVSTWVGYSPGTGEADVIRTVVFRANPENKTLTPIKASMKFAYNHTIELISPHKGLTDGITRKARTAATKQYGSRYWKVR